MFARPALILAEIAWRWAFGAAAWTLIYLAVHRIFGRTDVSQVEVLLAGRGDAFAIADAFARILSQVLPQLLAEALVLIPAIACLWIVAATVGRSVTLNALLSSATADPAWPGSATHLRPSRTRAAPSSGAYARVLFLHILRAALALAAGIATFGAILFVGAMLALQHPTAAVALSFVLVIVVLTCWSAVNWFMALAPIWLVRDGGRVFAAIGRSLELYGSNPGRYVGIAGAFGIMRMVVIIVATVAALVTAQSKPASAFAATFAVALGYFAISDFLYIARLAAYLGLDESTPQSPVMQPTTGGLFPHIAASLQDSNH